MSNRHNAFTLLEICLALFIGLLLVSLVVPSVAGVVAEQRLKHSFEDFDAFVQTVKLMSVRNHRAHRMIWDDKGITIEPPESAARIPGGSEKEASPVERFTFQKGEAFTVERTAALSDEPAGEWVFWANGICEPASIAFTGRDGNWTVRYDPLTVRGTFLESRVK
jgi:type II secretory pathway pseudopilin PulG